jgi:hypothetical protein
MLPGEIFKATWFDPGDRPEGVLSQRERTTNTVR